MTQQQSTKTHTQIQKANEYRTIRVTAKNRDAERSTARKAKYQGFYR